MAYKSLYSEKEVTSKQYICELICKNRADNTGTELPMNFWRVAPWSSYYIMQMSYISHYAKQYEEQDLIEFVKKNKIWSMGPSWIANALDKFIQENKNSKTRNIVFKDIQIKENPTYHSKKEESLDFLD